MKRYWVLMIAFVSVSQTACKLLDTQDSESIPGRGAQAFDPYQGAVSGAVRLSLLMYNGCAMLPMGVVAGRGNANIPYPNCKIRRDEATSRMVEDSSLPEPTEPIPLLAGTTYFLNQLALIETTGIHQDPRKMDQVAQWLRTRPKFSKLDWRNLSIVSDEYSPAEQMISPYAWRRLVNFGNANWQLRQDDTFTVEVLDAQGEVRTSTVYNRRDFLAENETGGHSMLRWMVTNIAPPLSPGDQNTPPLRPADPSPPGFIPLAPIAYHSIFKFEMVGLSKPLISIRIDPNFSGDGAIRVIWSQLPDDPFYFPVRFVPRTELPRLCYDSNDPTQRVPCDFGLSPEAVFSRPANGTHYQPGETVQISFRIKDSSGNLLHSPGAFPTWKEHINNAANGLLFFSAPMYYDLVDLDLVAGWHVSGPKQALRPSYELNDRGFFRLPTEQFIPGVGNTGLRVINGPFASTGAIPSTDEIPYPAAQRFELPADAKPGTYTLYLKFHRYFMGERFNKMQAIDFEVGQAETTNFPDRVGNCQICHRGVLSLENIKHGMGVDHVEGCKSCHNRDDFGAPRSALQRTIHRLHMNSEKFRLAKNNCTVCHLTRESALRPSYLACASCHPAPHGSEYESMETNTDFDPNSVNTIYGNCANSCHVLTAPTQHILPNP